MENIMGWKDILNSSPVTTEVNSISNCLTKIPNIPKIRMPEKEDLEYFDLDILHDRLYAEITDLNNRGISLMDFPAATRHKAFLIEQRITEAVNVGDVASFDQCLAEWRSCFH
jgi:hypothetical protein